MTAADALRVALYPGAFSLLIYRRLSVILISLTADGGQTIFPEVMVMKYVCNMCGWVYDEDEAGVKWEDLPDDFACEVCGVGKEDFSPEE